MKFKNSFWFGVTLLILIICAVLFHLNVTKKAKRCSKSSCANKRKGTAKRSKLQACKSPCVTPGCIKLADELSRKMDPDINPCQDFYSFACGNVMKEQDVFSLVEGEAYQPLKDILESEELQPGSALDKLKTIYETCANPETSETTAFADIVEFLENVGLREWPYLNDTYTFGPKKKVLADVIGHLISYMEKPFFGANAVSNSLLNDSREVFEFNMRWSIFPYDGDLDAIGKLIDQELRHNGVDDESAARIWNDFLSLHNAKLHAKESRGNDSEDEMINCKSASEAYQIFFCDIVKAIVSYSNISERLSDERLVLNGFRLSYFQKFLTLLEKYSDRTIANFIATNVLVNKLLYVRPEFRRLMFKSVDSTLMLVSKKTKTWLFCLSFVSLFEGPFERLFLSKALSANHIKKVKDLVMLEHRARIRIILNQTWIEGDLKATFFERFLRIETNLDSLSKETELEKVLENIHPTNRSFIANLIDLEKQLFSLKSATEEPYERSSFDGSAMAAQKITLSLGLMYSTFSPEYPKIFNLAQFGMIVGHEMGHQLFFFLGPERRSDSNTTYIFEERTECFIKQYSQFKMKYINKMVNASLTLHENLADSFGTMLVEKMAACDLRQMEDENFSLPSLEYTPEELMYIANAQVWCFAGDMKVRELLAEDSHSPPRFRVIGALQNSRRFAEVFNCPLTSPMNPPEKCSITE